MSQFFGILVEAVYLGDFESYSSKIHTCWRNDNLRHDADGFKRTGVLLDGSGRNGAGAKICYAALGPGSCQRGCIVDEIVLSWGGRSTRGHWNNNNSLLPDCLLHLLMQTGLVIILETGHLQVP